MKPYLRYAPMFILLIALSSTPLAQENTVNESGQLSIEKIVEDCEKQYSEQIYPDPEERNKLIDQCIDDNTVDQPPTPSE